MATASKTAAKKTTSDDKAKFVKELADILGSAGLAELEYKTESLAIRLSRLSGVAPTAGQPVAAPPSLRSPRGQNPSRGYTDKPS